VSDNADCDILMTGDFNARTCEEADYIPNDDITHMPIDEWYSVDNFNIPRCSRDNTVAPNAFGRYLLDMCSTFGIHMLNGRFPGDCDGEFTYSTKIGNSVVDYMLASTELFNNIRSFKVDNMTDSDHFPLVCELSCNQLGSTAETTRSAVRPVRRFKWDEAKCDMFLGKLGDDLLGQCMRSLDRNDVNHSVDLLVNVLHRAANDMEIFPRSDNVHPGTSRCAEWWDKECNDARRNKTRLLNIFRRTRSPNDLHVYMDSKTIYNNLCRTKSLNQRDNCYQN
jgi:hypothetical protein